MTVSENTVRAEGKGSFLKIWERTYIKEHQRTNVLKNPGRALDFTANNARAAASGNPKNVLSELPKAITFYHTGKGLSIGKYV